MSSNGLSASPWARVAMGAAIAAASLLGACAGVESTGRPYALSEGERASVRAVIADRLLDPESARFGDMGAVTLADGSALVCGYVNARTAAGGYAGMRPYQATIRAGAVAYRDIGNDSGFPSFSAAIVTNCRKAGVSM